MATRCMSMPAPTAPGVGENSHDAVLNSSLGTAGSGLLPAAASEWLAESLFMSGSMAIAMAVQTMPAKPSLLKRAV